MNPLLAKDRLEAEPFPTQDDFEEVKYAEMQVILEFDHYSTGRWPQIIEKQPIEEVTEAATPLPAPITHSDVFEMMEFLTNTPAAGDMKGPELSSDSTDLSSFVKKKRKTKKPLNPEDVIPAEALAQTKAFEREKPEAKEALKPKMGSGYEFAEMLDVKGNVAEYAKMKQNLARIVSESIGLR